MSAYVDAAQSAVLNAARFKKFMNETGGYVTDVGVNRETAQDMLSRKEAELTINVNAGIVAVNEARDDAIDAVNDAGVSAIGAIDGVLTQAEIARDTAISAADAAQVPIAAFYATKAAANAGLAGLTNGDWVEVAADESYSAAPGSRTRYEKVTGAYAFRLNLDQLRIETAPIASVADLRSRTGPTSKVRTLLAWHADSGQGGGDVEYDPDDVVSDDNSGTIFVDADGFRWKRRYTGPIDPRWFGLRVGGTYAGSAAINAALAVDYNLQLPPGRILLDASIGVADVNTEANQKIVGAAGGYDHFGEPTVLFAETAIDMVKIGSAGLLSDLIIDGGGIATSGVDSGFMNQTNVKRVRVQRCVKGFKIVQTQNSLFESCDSRNNSEHNWHLNSPQNCTFLNCTGDLNNATTTVSATTRQIYITNALYPVAHNNHFIGGIFERGTLLNDYCIEIIGTSVDFIGTQFEGGGVSIAKLTGAAGQMVIFDSASWAFTGSNYAISADATAVYELKGQQKYTGQGGRIFPQMCVGGITASSVLLESRFDTSLNFLLPGGTGTATWVNNGSTVAFNPTDRCMDVATTVANAVFGARAIFATANSPDANFWAGRHMKIEVIVSDISTANPLNLYWSLPGSPFRRLLGTAANGYTQIVAAMQAGDYQCGFEFGAGEAVLKSWKVHYVKLTLL